MSGLILPRRAFLAGLASALAAPAVVKAASLMPIKAPALDIGHMTLFVDLSKPGSDRTICFTAEWSDDLKRWRPVGELPPARYVRYRVNAWEGIVLQTDAVRA